MSSSRALAAAQQRRANPPQPPPTTRPGMSIKSNTAFIQNQPQSSRIRGPAYQQPNPQMMQQPSMNPQMMQQQQSQNKLPFSKLSVSDAIGLITLRLGRVEQHLIDSQGDNEGQFNPDSMGIPDNMKLIDNSVLASIINRLDSLEQNPVSGEGAVSLEQLEQLQTELRQTKEMITPTSMRLIDNRVLVTILSRLDALEKNNNSNNVNLEKISYLQNELAQTKDQLSVLTSRFELFVCEVTSRLDTSAQTNQAFTDDSIESSEDVVDPTESTNVAPLDISNLKELVQQELNAESSI